jgi:NAD-dependent SIR2 family protein deacetylase
MPLADDIASLELFTRSHRRLFVLTGAGLSTASAIPDYRDVAGAWKRSPPMTIERFRGSHAARQRYWARSMLGWPMLKRARPNPAHHALERLRERGQVELLVTQNVDTLHRQAGSDDVCELHGAVDQVICLACGTRCTRESVQRALLARNDLSERLANVAPDGDADLDDEALQQFVVPACSRCGGVLKPDVVFFGEGVPRERTERALTALARADAMLVIGSSLMVYSGYRFCEHAARSGTPIAAINLGRTRADALFAIKLERDCSEVLPALVDRLEERAARVLCTDPTLA